MGKLRDHQSKETTKLLFIGHSGTGKTGALASLACAGYNLRILDLDNGADIVRNLLLDPRSPYYSDAAADRVDVITITDKMKVSGGKLIQEATAFNRAAELMINWKDPDTGVSLGPVTSWTSRDILVIDSLSRLCDAAMAKQLSSVGRLGGKVEQSDWYFAQGMVENFLRNLYDKGVACNVLVLCHIVFIETDGAPTKGYPQSLGKALSPKIGQYFNNMLQADTKGFGATARKVILTRPSVMIELKTAIPLSVPAEYPMEHGLASFFKEIRGGQQPIPWEYPGPIPLGPIIAKPAAAAPAAPKAAQ